MAPLISDRTDNLSKLAPITAAFWAMKIAATTLGETAGDLLSMTLAVGYALSSALLLSIFLCSLGGHLAARRYVPWIYWMTILLTSTAGTTISDFIDRTLGLGYALGAGLLITALLGVLGVWRVVSGSIAVDTVASRKSEIFYWLAILISNTLGTALGDFVADNSGLGFAGGAAVIATLLALVLAATFLTDLSRVALFWIAFVLTRPFGATLGDILTKSRPKGGLDLGTGGSSGVLLVILIALVAHATVLQRRSIPSGKLNARDAGPI